MTGTEAEPGFEQAGPDEQSGRLAASLNLPLDGVTEAQGGAGTSGPVSAGIGGVGGPLRAAQSDGGPVSQVEAIRVLGDLCPQYDAGQLAILADLVTSGVPLRQERRWGVQYGHDDPDHASFEYADDREQAQERLEHYPQPASVVSRATFWGPWQAEAGQ